MRLYYLFILLFLTLNCKSQSDMKLIYIGDPMCSWCYGIAPQLEEVIEVQSEKMEVVFIMGGLRPHFDKKMIEMKSFLSQHWQEVNQATSQPFNYGILNDKVMAYDTEPPCRAVVTVRNIKPEIVDQFFKLTQEQFYVDNMDMNAASSYHKNLKTLDIDISVFDAQFSSEDMQKATANDFVQAQKLGVNSFPTILLEYNGQVHKVCNGYRKAAEINAIIDNIISDQ